MHKARVFNHSIYAGSLIQNNSGTYAFIYDKEYQGPPISLTMPLTQHHYSFDTFPPFFDGLLPEGFLLNALLKSAKLDRTDYFEQLLTVGHNLVGSVTVEKIK